MAEITKQNKENWPPQNKVNWAPENLLIIAAFLLGYYRIVDDDYDR